MGIIQVDEKTCTKCGICVSVCPLGLIDIRDEGYPESVPGVESCIKCGACITLCPNGSLALRDMPFETLQTIDTSLKVNVDQMTQLLKTRRSVRAYKNTPIPREDIKRLIDAARYAPTGANRQEVKWLVIDDEEKLRRISEVGSDFMIETMKNIPNYTNAVDFFIRRKKSGYDIFLHSAPAVVATYTGKSDSTVPSIDCTIAISYFDLAANSMGLGCCWLGFFTVAANSYPPLKEIIALPEGNQIHACMTVGYPKYNYLMIPQRNPSDITWRS